MGGGPYVEDGWLPHHPDVSWFNTLPHYATPYPYPYNVDWQALLSDLQAQASGLQDLAMAYGDDLIQPAGTNVNVEKWLPAKIHTTEASTSSDHVGVPRKPIFVDSSSQTNDELQTVDEMPKERFISETRSVASDATQVERKSLGVDAPLASSRRVSRAEATTSALPRNVPTSPPKMQTTSTSKVGAENLTTESKQNGRRVNVTRVEGESLTSDSKQNFRKVNVEAENVHTESKQNSGRWNTPKLETENFNSGSKLSSSRSSRVFEEKPAEIYVGGRAMAKEKVEAAATVIQAGYRGYLVRRSKPLRDLRTIADIEERVWKMEEKASDAGFKAAIRTPGSIEKLRFVEQTMALLFQLDGIQDVHPVVRGIRKGVARDIIFLQERIDALSGAQ